MQRTKRSYLFIIAILIFTMGCSFSGFSINRVQVGEWQYDSQVIELGDAEEVRVDVRMGAGELNINNRAESLLEADFTYNIDSWKPKVSYTVEDQQGRLTVRQPQTNQLNVSGNLKYEWDLRFARDIPLDMRIECGAGNHDLDFSNLFLTSLDMRMGAGNAMVDLTDNPDLDNMEFNIGAGNIEIDLDGIWHNDVQVDIQGGVGRIAIRLPKDIGVQVNVSKGIGNVVSSGLTKDGNTYRNGAYGESDVLMNIHIQAGVGQIELIVSP